MINFFFWYNVNVKYFYIVNQFKIIYVDFKIIIIIIIIIVKFRNL